MIAAPARPTIDLRLRYVIAEGRKTLLLAAPDGTWTPLALISPAITRDSPSAEGAWKEMLGSAIETAAEAAAGVSS